MGYYEGQPVPPFSKHLGAASEAMPIRRGTSQVFTILRCVSNVGKKRQRFFGVFFFFNAAPETFCICMNINGNCVGGKTCKSRHVSKKRRRYIFIYLLAKMPPQAIMTL